MWRARRWRIVVGAVPAGAVSSRFVSTLSGGGGAGVPSTFSRIHWPRFTGEVRFGADVTVSTLPWPSSPRRSPSPSSTRRKRLPRTYGIP